MNVKIFYDGNGITQVINADTGEAIQWEIIYKSK